MHHYPPDANLVYDLRVVVCEQHRARPRRPDEPCYTGCRMESFWRPRTAEESAGRERALADSYVI